ncbi:unnamed protein product [Ciceribacter sp. T2.26MG-112.2]|nr:unnamed protein product [Ciceribacter naphthalenivorans]
MFLCHGRIIGGVGSKPKRRNEVIHRKRGGNRRFPPLFSFCWSACVIS